MKTQVEDRTNKPLQTSSKGIYVAHIHHPQCISYYTQIHLREREKQPLLIFFISPGIELQNWSITVFQISLLLAWAYNICRNQQAEVYFIQLMFIFMAVCKSKLAVSFCFQNILQKKYFVILWFVIMKVTYVPSSDFGKYSNKNF